MAGHRNRCRTARRRARRTSVAVAVVVLALGGCARDTSTAAGSTASVIDLYEGGVWRRVPHDEAVFGGDGYQSMLAITAGGPGLVAVGYEAIGGDSDAAVWTSPDGVTWSQVPHDEAVFGGEGPQKMLAVVAGGPGLVAVGYEFSDEHRDAAVWTSVDGLTWVRVAHDESVFGGEGPQEMLAVVAGGPGLVAVGHDFADGDGDAAVWTSEDGMIWTRVCQETEVFGGDSYQMMTAVAVGGPGLVAVGRDGESGAVWTSVDGLTWLRVAHDEAVFGGGMQCQITGITVGGPGLVAVGSECRPDFSNPAVDMLAAPCSLGGSWTAAVWVSPDGVAWTRVPCDGEVFGGELLGMVSIRGGYFGLVAVGWHVWTSQDGFTWTRHADDELSYGLLEDVTAGGTGLVAVGWVFDCGDEDGGTTDGDPAIAVCNDSDAAVWVFHPS
jgi:hypothetical protein